VKDALAGNISLPLAREDALALALHGGGAERCVSGAIEERAGALFTSARSLSAALAQEPGDDQNGQAHVRGFRDQ
jgi:hypothetical protein